MAKQRKKESCTECTKLRKRLKDAEEREKLLGEGIDILLKEIRELSGKKPILKYRERKLKL